MKTVTKYSLITGFVWLLAAFMPPVKPAKTVALRAEGRGRH